MARAPVLLHVQRPVDYDWAAAELEREQALAARPAGRRAAGCDSAGHFAGPRSVAELHWVAEPGLVVALRSAARLVEQVAGPELDAQELPRRWVCLAGLAGRLQRRLASHG